MSETPGRSDLDYCYLLANFYTFDVLNQISCVFIFRFIASAIPAPNATHRPYKYSLSFTFTILLNRMGLFFTHEI